MSTFYLTTKWKIILSLWKFTLVCLVFAPFAYYSRSFSIIYLAMGILGCLLSVYSLFKDRIVFTEKGIEFHQWVYVFDVTWANVTKIGQHWFREGLLINKEPIKHFGNHYNFVTCWGLGRYVFIPLSSFSSDWRNAELGQLIKQHAPHLFEKEKSAQSA